MNITKALSVKQDGEGDFLLIIFIGVNLEFWHKLQFEKIDPMKAINARLGGGIGLNVMADIFVQSVIAKPKVILVSFATKSVYRRFIDQFFG